ncbi:serine/threonine protein kinase [Paenibacillus lemnae]|uniref:Serine/threonine protein kinase n=1 Tax=Paenibacillus lemnae TaxID=1330551 RepID=A0A848M6B7_PAELE|nr:serine/threonine protein kinase [Paenibacillus lemnae]NMO96275.1 serine/threonine protein kinase [Paenibacillus lemnae]
MSFQPNPGDEIIINGTAYKVGQHPAAPGLAYAQAGRQGIVYQLLPVQGEVHEAKALKVFFPKFRIPAMVYQSDHMATYKDIPGLQVCSREVLTPERNGDLIAGYPDLLYAVVMPWIHGITWFDVISDQRNLARGDSLMLAKALAAIGSSMEQRGLAHCDLSAPNVMLPFFSEVELPEGSAAVELVDVEQIYSPKMDRPDVLLAGSPGYAAHRTVHSGLWSAYADRFAGAVIIAEMLGWSDPAVVGKAWGESYFDQHEMQTTCERYFLLKKSLSQRWGQSIADLFGRAWDSQDLSSCPTFGEWLVALSALSEEEPAAVVPETAAAAEAEDKPQVDGESAERHAAETLGLQPGNREVNDNVVGRLFNQARDLEAAGNLSGALEIFRSAYHFVKKDSPLEVELAAAIHGLEAQLNPPSEEKTGWRAFVSSKRFMVSAAAAVAILTGSAFTVNQILADKAETRVQQEAEAAAKLAAEEKAKAAEEARLKEEQAAKLAADKKAEEERKKAEEESKKAEALKAEEARKKAEAEEKAKKAEEVKLAAEKAKLQEKYDKQAKYEAYLAQVEANKKKAALQEKYDKQEKYEQYLVQLEEQKKRQAREAEAARQAEAARKAEAQRQAESARKAEAQRQAEAARKAEAQRQAAAQLKKQRAENVVTLIAYYNKAYNAQVAGNLPRARNFARSFTSMYQKDAAYYNKVGKMRTRLNGINLFLKDSSFWLPSI